MKSVYKENPIIALNEAFQSKVEESKLNLFSSLDTLNPAIGAQIKKRYYLRKQKQPSPYLGELYPWVIQELFNLKNTDAIKDISQHWLALYYYTIFTDDIVDGHGSLDGKEIISLTALMKQGLFKLYKVIDNTPFEEQFEVIINNVLNHGKKEEEFNGLISERSIKVQYTENKNDLLKICAMAIIAKCDTSENQSQKILEFTDKLQLCFQYLDDISDLKEDFNDSNITVILNDLFESVGIKTVSEDNLLQKLVESGTLLNFVIEIKTLFTDIQYFIQDLNDTKSKQYFTNLYNRIVALEFELGDLGKQTPITEKKIKDVEQGIRIVAQST